MFDLQTDTIGSGELGGKGHGLERVRQLLQDLVCNDEHRAMAECLALPKTVVVATAVFREFMESNGLDALANQVETGDARRYEELMERFQAGDFPTETTRRLTAVLEEFRAPLAVRSSSLLEDRKGASFAGKYETVLIGNQGPEVERRRAFLDAIKRVYASTFNPSAISYRRKHGFIDDREEMAIVVQEIVGQKYRDFYLPAMAGVAFSQNGYCWSSEMRKQDGLVRLVFGLGTRAVGREYVRLFTPAKPSVRPEGTEVNNILKCSQKKVDVIDMRTNSLTAVHFRELIENGFDCFPDSQAMVSLRDGNFLYRPASNLWDPGHVPVLTMDGVLEGAWMGLDVARTLGWLLRQLEQALGFAVDVEFAINPDAETKTAKLYVLQTRPLSEAEDRKPQPLPRDLADEDVICRVHRNLPTAHVPDIEYLVYVDDVAYNEWPYSDKYSVARVIGRVNEALQGKRFALIGPGRWGSWNPGLGVPVKYSEICHTAMLVEVARRRATYTPEVSFGSHFFQDLIEDRIAYLPVYPDEPNETFQDSLFARDNVLPELLTDPYFEKFTHLIKVIHVPRATRGRKAHAILNGDLGQAVVFLK